MIILKQVPNKKDAIAAYLYCPRGKTYVVKQDPQTGKLYEKQGAGPWHPLDPRGKSRGK